MADTLKLEIVTPDGIVVLRGRGDGHAAGASTARSASIPHHVPLLTQIVPGRDHRAQGRPRRRSSPSAKGSSRSPATASRSSPTWRSPPTTSTKRRSKRRASAPRRGCATRSRTRKSRRSTRRSRDRWRSCKVKSATAAWLTMVMPGARVAARRTTATWLRGDLVAGRHARRLPAARGNRRRLARRPAARRPGLYACLFGGLVFWLFCSSRHTAVTVTSAISLLVGASLGEIAGGDPARYAALAACTALMVAALAFVACAVRAGSDRQLLLRDGARRLQVRRRALSWRARSCRSCSASTAATATSGSAMGHFLRGLGGTNPTSLALGAAALVAAGARQDGVLKHRPVALVRRRRRHRRGADAAPRRARRGAARRRARGACRCRRCRWSSRADLNALLPLAMACFLLAAVETSAIGRMFAGQARLPARRDAGVPRPRRRQSRRRPRPRISGQRRHVAVARQRNGRRPHAAVRAGRRAHHARRRGRSSPACCATCRSRCSRRSCWSR